MRITADANVMIRVLIEDHPTQAAIARAILTEAERIAVPIAAICEIVWVLERTYHKTAAEIASVLRSLTNNNKLDLDRDAVNAGLAMLDAGGGFADGVIAFDGRRLGGDVLVTFDRKAARLVSEQGGQSRLL